MGMTERKTLFNFQRPYSFWNSCWKIYLLFYSVFW